MSDTWLIEPSAPLRGDIRVNGAKNSATKHMVAAMLAGTPSTIRNVPEVGDVAITSEIFRYSSSALSLTAPVRHSSPSSGVTGSARARLIST